MGQPNKDLTFVYMGQPNKDLTFVNMGQPNKDLTFVYMGEPNLLPCLYINYPEIIVVYKGQQVGIGGADFRVHSCTRDSCSNVGREQLFVTLWRDSG